MSLMCVPCPNCGNPTQTTTLNGDGVCPRCATGRISSPPPVGVEAAPNVAKTVSRSYHQGKLHREPVKSKIPLAAFLARNPVFPLPPTMPSVTVLT